MKENFSIKLNRFGKSLLNILLKRSNFTITPLMYGLDKVRKNFVFENEYIRNSTLELLSYEIYDKNILGSVAELGVYKGNFAKNINKAFPDRKFYLFDTFEGFDERDLKTEIKENYSSGKAIFSNTSENLVLSLMKYKENCIIKKGYFPETAHRVNDKFSFVSIDVDLYDPTYQGLAFFYKCLSSGGFIMIHDYNNKSYKGVKAALRIFSREYSVPYFPLCDAGGSVIINKP